MPTEGSLLGPAPAVAGQPAAAAFVSRNELLAGLAVVGFANGIAERASQAVAAAGIASALVGTFDVSIVVWAAAVIGLGFLLRGPAQPVRSSDRVVAVCALGAFLAPVAAFSWLAITALAVHGLRTSPRASFLHRGAWILLALTVPMFWARLVFATLSEWILQVDATLVSWLVGTSRLGNAVRLADDSGNLWIAPGCSSLANVSLAVLCWVTAARAAGRRSTVRDAGWLVLACTAVVAINVTRISLMGLYPKDYHLIHGPVGAAAANALILGAMVAICLFGVRPHRSIRFPAGSDMALRPGLVGPFGLVLAASLLVKLPGLVHSAPAEASVPVFPDQVAMTLERQGFSVAREAPAEDLAWVTGTAGRCEVVVTEVSPQGWQRSLVARTAQGHRLAYLFGGTIYPEQPLMRTRLDYYWARLKRSIGRTAPGHPVIAVISTSSCAGLPLRELAGLSGG